MSFAPFATWLGADRVSFSTCGSTNDEAAQLAREGAAHGTVVIADTQTSGRGRGSHDWYSPPGSNLYMSIILRPTVVAAECPPLTLAAGLGVYDSVAARDVTAALKWPNDVYVARRKLAGILTEMTSRGSAVDYVVVGIGVNLNQSEFPPPLDATATSLRMHTCAAVDRDSFTEDLLGALEQWFERLERGGLAAIRDRWNERALAGRVRVTSAGEIIEGHADGLDDAGGLRVIDAAGRARVVIAGEVELLD